MVLASAGRGEAAPDCCAGRRTGVKIELDVRVFLLLVAVVVRPTSHTTPG